MSVAKVFPLRARYEAGQPSPWHMPAPASQPQNTEIATATPGLRNWARHLAANSSIIGAVLDSRACNAIGTGLTYEPMVRTTDGALAEKVNARIRKVLDDWRKAPEVTGELSCAALEELAWRAWDTDGEIFLRQLVMRGPGIPYRTQLIESDLVPFSAYGPDGLVDGIEQDDWGRPVAYHVYRRRPGIQSLSADMVRIPAESMRHVKRMVRPDQARGLTLVHAVVFRVSDIAEYAQAHRLAARASSDLYATITRSPDWRPTLDSDGNEQDERNWQFEHLQILDNLQPGEGVDYLSPAHPNQNATEFLHEEMRQIAAGTRSSFSQIANVFDRAYAAQRLEIVHAWRLVEQDRARFIKQLARPALYEAPLEWAIASGMINIPRRGIDLDTLYDVRIEGPVMPTIDPVNDRKADELDQVNRWDSRHAIIRRRGRTPQEVDGEIEQDQQNEQISDPGEEQ